MSCERERVSDWIDGLLEADEAAAVEAHVRGCEACAREAAWLKAEAELFARRRQEQAPLSPELWRGVEERLAAGSLATPVEPVPLKRARLRWTVALPFAMAAAAALLVLVRPTPPLVSRAPNEARDQAPGARPPPPDRGRDDQRKRDDQRQRGEDALTRAEDQDREAIAALEAEYQRRHPDRWARVSQVHAKLDVELAHARGDVDTRMALLDGYEEYLHSLATMLEEP